jgi:hypothetical protein
MGVDVVRRLEVNALVLLEVGLRNRLKQFQLLDV